eukprot:4855641-Pyramimonas_sp.AAC.1
MEARPTAAQEELKERPELVQDQRATVASFEFHPDDSQNCEECSPGQLIRPRFLLQEIWLQ